MPQIWRDNLQVTVSGTPGTGAFTVSTPSSGYQGFVAGDDGNYGYFCAKEGTAWETFKGTYTHSGTSLARTTRTDSSTGLAISFTSAAIVFLDLTASIAAQFAFPQNIITGTDAATTMVANATYVVPVGSFTADRIYALPPAPAVGDMVALVVSTGSASYECIIKGNTSQTITIGGVTTATASEGTRLFIAGESLIVLYIASNTWLVAPAGDGRIAMHGAMRLTTSATAETAATFTYPTAKSGVWTIDTDVGGICATATEKFTARRACKALITAMGYSVNNITSLYSVVTEMNGGAAIFPVFSSIYPGASSKPGIGGSAVVLFAVDEYIRYQYYSTAGSIGLLANARTNFSFTEIL